MAAVILFYSSGTDGDEARATLAENKKLEVESTPDWLIPSAHCAGVLVLQRIGLSIIWPESFDVTEPQKAWDNFKTSWSTYPQFDAKRNAFEWDYNPWYQNAVGHTLMGSEFYLRHRQTLHDPYVSMAMALAWTGVWEYVIEAWSVQPSAIDLIWTPIGGALLGEARYVVYTEIVKMKDTAGRHVLLYLIDPLGQFERDVFGLEY